MTTDSTYETREFLVRPTRVKKGDTLQQVEPDVIVSGKTIATRTPTVTDTKTGDKNVTFETDLGRLIVDGSIENGETVVISREVRTAAYRREQHVRRLRERLESFVGGEARAIEAFEQYAEKNGFVYALSWGHAGDPVEARVKERYATDILHAVDRDDNPMDIFDACDAARELATKELMSKAGRAASRSTSVWSNLIEDIERATLVDMVDSRMGWLMGYDERDPNGWEYTLPNW